MGKLTWETPMIGGLKHGFRVDFLINQPSVYHLKLFILKSNGILAGQGGSPQLVSVCFQVFTATVEGRFFRSRPVDVFLYLHSGKRTRLCGNSSISALLQTGDPSRLGTARGCQRVHLNG